MSIREISYVSRNSFDAMKSTGSTDLENPSQPPPTPCTCRCNPRNTVTSRISYCSRRWATIIISTLVLVTFVIVAIVMFAVLNETQGKSNSPERRPPIFFRTTPSVRLPPNITDGISSGELSSTVSSL
nr:uncharacterized protein LOC117683841 [Crassostrea gigas]